MRKCNLNLLCKLEIVSTAHFCAWYVLSEICISVPSCALVCGRAGAFGASLHLLLVPAIFFFFELLLLRIGCRLATWLHAEEPARTNRLLVRECGMWSRVLTNGLPAKRDIEVTSVRRPSYGLGRVWMQNSKIFFRHLHGDLNLDEIKNALRLLSVNGETNLMNLIRL